MPACDPPRSDPIRGGVAVARSWLVKPLASAGGRGSAPCWAGPATRARTIIQERLRGPAVGRPLRGGAGGARSGSAVTASRWGVPGSPFAYRGSLGPWPIDPHEAGRIERPACPLAGSFGLGGLFGVRYGPVRGRTLAARGEPSLPRRRSRCWSWRRGRRSWPNISGPVVGRCRGAARPILTVSSARRSSTPID